MKVLTIPVLTALSKRQEKRRPLPPGAKQHRICPTIGARVVPTRSSSIRGDRFIKTFQGIPAFTGAAAWDKPRPRYSVQLHPITSDFPELSLKNIPTTLIY
jgi:hypothetical protein